MATDRTEFTTDYAGVWTYNRGTDPVLHHIANGVFGMVILGPEDGLPPVERELLLVQNEWYLGEQGEVSSLEKANQGAPSPDVVMFNGVAKQHADNPIEVPTGEDVRLFVLDVGPSIDSSFHIVGTIFHDVIKEGVRHRGRQRRQLGIPGGCSLRRPGDHHLPGPGLTRPAASGRRRAVMADPAGVVSLEVLSPATNACASSRAAAWDGSVWRPARRRRSARSTSWLDGDRIVVRTGDSILWRAARASAPAEFEIDAARNDDHSGWSVIATGRLSEVDPEDRTPLTAATVGSGRPVQVRRHCRWIS